MLKGAPRRKQVLKGTRRGKRVLKGTRIGSEGSKALEEEIEGSKALQEENILEKIEKEKPELLRLTEEELGNSLHYASSIGQYCFWMQLRKCQELIPKKCLFELFPVTLLPMSRAREETKSMITQVTFAVAVLVAGVTFAGVLDVLALSFSLVAALVLLLPSFRNPRFQIYAVDFSIFLVGSYQ
ncbi:hypothetical protein POTOM_044638 [Populus tomentosa]|uniref:Uncharacterized protein n=1 Tax=Populus tomentosa TaxID=118781 RepID=A0A8X7YKA9_POPTO|nr:hypothetical protein POTOM_044638 [Populus tomentosa]